MQKIGGTPAVLIFQGAAESHALSSSALANDIVQTDKGAAADKKNIGCVDLQKFLLRVLASAFGRHARHGSFDNLQQSLLHTFAGHVAGNRRIVRLTRNLVDLVDVNDAALRFFDVVVGGLQKIEDNIFNVLADV